MKWSGSVAIDGIGHDAEFEGIELGQLSQKTATLAIGAVIGFRIRIVEQLGFPVRRRVGNGVYFVNDVLPVPLQVLRAGENARHADDGHLGAPVTVQFQAVHLLREDKASPFPSPWRLQTRLQSMVRAFLGEVKATGSGTFRVSRSFTAGSRVQNLFESKGASLGKSLKINAGIFGSNPQRQTVDSPIEVLSNESFEARRIFANQWDFPSFSVYGLQPACGGVLPLLRLNAPFQQVAINTAVSISLPGGPVFPCLLSLLPHVPDRSGGYHRVGATRHAGWPLNKSVEILEGFRHDAPFLYFTAYTPTVWTGPPPSGTSTVAKRRRF